MRRFLLYLLIGIFFALLQSSVLPLFFAPNWRPNLILILVLFLSFHESLPLAVFGGMFLGAIQDSFCGPSLGLYVSADLAIVMLTKLVAEQLNVESPPLLLLLVAAGTLVQNALLGFFLTAFADTEPVISILLPAIPQQLLANLVFSALLLVVYMRLLKWFGYRGGLGSLLYQGKHYGH